MSYLGATIPATGTPADGLELALWRKNSSCETTRRGVYQAHGHEFDWEGTMNFKGQLTTATAATAFTLAGNATITLVSKRTGARFTYKVRRPKPTADDPVGTYALDTYFVSLLTGADNEGDFQYLGFIRTTDTSSTQRRGFFHGGRKTKITMMAPSYTAFAWFWGKVAAQGVLPEELEVWHEGRCGRCGRKLTVPSSIASGFGPDCIDLASLQGGLF